MAKKRIEPPDLVHDTIREAKSRRSIAYLLVLAVVVIGAGKLASSVMDLGKFVDT